MSLLAFFEFGVAELPGILFFVLIGPVLALVCILDIIKSDFRDATTKLIWALVVLFLPFIGPIAYLAVGRSTKV